MKTETKFIQSPLNYIGGKYKLLPQILPYFPQKINTFVDLFCGGCNVGINVDAQKIVFNDNLSYLIDLYKTFHISNNDTVIGHIDNRINQFNLSLTNAEGYKHLRQLYNEERNPLDLFVLVAYSFNHQIRFNNSHEFNNPFGKERSSFNPKMKSNLDDFLNALQTEEGIEYYFYFPNNPTDKNFGGSFEKDTTLNNLVLNAQYTLTDRKFDLSRSNNNYISISNYYDNNLGSWGYALDEGYQMVRVYRTISDKFNRRFSRELYYTVDRASVQAIMNRALEIRDEMEVNTDE